MDDMCINSCAAFTGLFADLESCPRCKKPHYDPDKLEKSRGEIKVPRKKFTTFPVGPQIQARWEHPETAKKMLYWQTRFLPRSFDRVPRNPQEKISSGYNLGLGVSDLCVCPGAWAFLWTATRTILSALLQTRARHSAHLSTKHI